MSRHFKRPERGASGITYGLLVGLISVVALAAITTSGQSINGLFSTTSGTLKDVVDENAQPLPSASASASASASPSPTGYLVITDTTLSATLSAQLGSASTWTLCYEAPEGTGFDHPSVDSGCGDAGETLLIDHHGSTFSGAYVSEPLENYYSSTWQYPNGFYFSSVPARASNVYDHTGTINASGDVRIEFNPGVSSERFHINAYKYSGNSTHNYYVNNGTWTAGWNLVDGSGSTTSTQVHTRIYRR